MTIKRLPDREQWVMDSLAAKMGERRGGKHLTDSVYCNIKAWAAARLGAAGHELPRHDPGSIVRMAIGVGLGDVIEQGHMHQMTVGSADDDSVGTIDILYKGKVVEIKCTWQSSNKSPDESAHWMEQTGGYAARWMKPDAKFVTAEFWVIHLGGDGGAMYCPNGHDRPDNPPRRIKEGTGRMRMYCDECGTFYVAGNREPEVRCWEKTWPAEELRSLHQIQTQRQAQLDRDIKNPEYQIGGELPPVRWGFQEFECKGCTIKERIGCGGIEGQQDLEAQLSGSILELQKEEATA